MKKSLIIGIFSAIIVVIVAGSAFFLGTRHGEPREIVSSVQVSGNEEQETSGIGNKVNTKPDSGVGVVDTPSFAEHSVGYLGCSMTVNAIEGYHTEGGKVLWGETGDFGGGTIGAWAGLLQTSTAYWNGFDAILAKNPGTKAVWMELCISVKKGGVTTDTYENALKVREDVLRRIPGATIYVSAQPGYAEGHVCGIAGPDGPAKMQTIADQMVANGFAKAGPVMGPLANGQTADPCHANGIGKSIMGKQLVEFFGR